MNLIFDELPKAIRWSKIVAIFVLIAVILQVLGLVGVMTSSLRIDIFAVVISVIMLAISIWFWWMLRGYKIACVQALDTQDSDDLELAARKQVMIIRFFGFLSLLCLIMLVIALAGIVLAVVFAR